ncbi:histidine kinase/DNA gyrase B/HSP90-like ATPase [Litoreibacter ponti]|uniref:histidine kinase n=2 Tax=Litoreibacter ponti TaxID=1510457 RepID=A0A2T6BJI0_9RHOB|nr:histidine kinase/DNA gyrase B/HSP90-like ATPase [Litoreibacter ponti]
MVFIRLRFLLACLLACVSLSAAQAETPVRMAYVEFPPYSFTGPGGAAEGLSIDLARALLEEAELSFIPAASPDEMITMLRDGRADISTLLGLTEDRLARADATDPLGAFGSALFTKAERAGDEVAAFSGDRIGVVRGSIAVQIAQGIPFAKLVEYETPDDQILGLLVGDVDAVVGATDSFAARLRLMELDRAVQPVEPPLEEFPYAFYVSPDRPELLSAMNTRIRDTLTPSELSTLNEIWFGSPSVDPNGELIAYGVLGLVLLLGMVMSISLSLRKKAARLEEVSQKAQATNLLVEAMNAVHSAVVVYDKDLRAIHWNDGFSSAFPKLVPLIERGASLQELVIQSYETGVVSGVWQTDETRHFADDLARKLRRGQSITRMIRGRNGRTFEATELPLGNGYFASLRVDVTGLLDQAALIEAQKKELESANEKLQIFATIAAHDLKAPLVQQSSILQVIREDIAEADQDFPDDVQDYFGMLETLSDRMRHLIQGLLDHARADEELSESELVDVNERMPSIVEMVGLPDNFRIEIQPDLPSLRVAPATFDAVMRNLISNAIKHHDRKMGVIKIRGKRIGDQTVFEVEDDGPGIPQEHLSSIFDPFKRLSANVEGSGLGLSFIKKTVNQWGGGIYVESRTDRGSIFVFSVPVDTARDFVGLDQCPMPSAALH